MTTSHLAPILALRFTGWTILVLVVLMNIDLSAKTSVSRPDVTGSAQALVATYECSSAVQDPTHVVVTIDGVTRYAGQRMTDMAIEQAMFGVDHGLTVHGFCS